MSDAAHAPHVSALGHNAAQPAFGTPHIVVVHSGGASIEAAERVAARLSAPLLHPNEVAPGQLELRVCESGLTLARDGLEMQADFSRMLPRLRAGALQRELLVRAARIKGADGPTALDATAGLGEDALLLAATGFTVTLCELDPVIYLLLEDAHRRALQDERLAPLAARMRLVQGDSIAVLRAIAASEAGELPSPPDVVYLDPMFPGRTKSAAVKKKFQLIHGLEQPCSSVDEEALVRAALAARPRKVVIKRPIKGAYLAGIKPSHSLTGKAVRYDCLIPPQA